VARRRDKVTAALAAFAAAAVLIALTGSERAAGAIPWGAGCTSLPPSGQRTSSTCGATLVDGRAIAPPQAPALVKRVIAAANRIDGRPYAWGGGHAGWEARGYDCSGAVGYALHGGGLLETTMVSGQLADWGESGIGRWLTVYANRDHVFMVVAGLRFDTRDAPPGVTGPRWHRAGVDPGGFAARHPAGL
jgi:cell wall-associated NlpC family hydrolase